MEELLTLKATKFTKFSFGSRGPFGPDPPLAIGCNSWTLAIYHYVQVIDPAWTGRFHAHPSNRFSCVIMCFYLAYVMIGEENSQVFSDSWANRSAGFCFQLWHSLFKWPFSCWQQNKQTSSLKIGILCNNVLLAHHNNILIVVYLLILKNFNLNRRMRQPPRGIQDF